RFGAKAVCTAGMLLVSASFAGYALLGQHSSIWLLEALFFVQGFGMGNIMPPATESIMSALPREKAGAGSAINNVSRQVGSALGVAVLGSILAASYRTKLTPTLKDLPVSDAVRTQMGKSVQATYAVVERAGGALNNVIPTANAAFIHAMHVTALFSGVVALLGTFVAFKFLPGRPVIAATAPGTATAPATPLPARETESVTE
ncbi:MAG: hypothetical protein QOJ62_1972, partial [Actinomycetota bacterium]|nr:hypothetical protein [Actinomycetota bacterium]